MSFVRLTVEVGGMRFTTRDWSLGGLCIEGILRGHALDEALPVRVSGVRKGKVHRVDLTARLIRIDHARVETAMAFDDLEPADLDKLQALITGR
ncbi:MAG: PilZ domain-containing protein [Alphaproteobacteria bacterium]|jgi:hypothetical protein|nr:PilZ domain-containing protein [Alphaproteobacteria bacterium]MDP6567500.1 PilZ domain-containing protein [Alphaproteobacteria bacterium]MDP6813339.1 PilZ domain-containing protein [Alphaproteobacteria bacterium]